MRSGEDWDKFRQLVIEAHGESEVNAIMDADISTGNSCGNYESPYTGTFNGNGHTLNINIWSSSSYRGAFPEVKNATFRALRVKGSVRGGLHAAGLIGITRGSSTVHIERVWVSTDVIGSSDHVGGFIGHADVASVYMNDCRYDGKLQANGASGSYGGAIIGWCNSGGLWYFHRVYDYSTWDEESIKYRWFSVNHGERWDSNDRSSSLVTRWNWEKVNYYNKTDQTEVVNLMNGEKSGTWHLVGGVAAPVMETWPEAGDVNFETYDMVLGTEDSEKGMLKIPFSCDQAVKYIDVTYVNENGQTKSIHQDCKDNTYAGFILVPATEQHTSLKITAKLTVGTVTKTLGEGQDAVLHSPLGLSATLLRYDTHGVLTDAGAVELKWKVNDAAYKDIIPGDQFIVMRSLTGKDEDLQSIGIVQYDENTTDYTFKDSTLTSALDNNQLKGRHVSPQYLIIRGAARELWGITDNPASTRVTTTLYSVHLMRVSTDYTTKWEDEAAHTVRVTWDYVNEDGAVWDSRAQMKLRIKMVNRDGFAVDTITHVLTAAEMEARTKVVQLPRSCLYYNIDFAVEFDNGITAYMTPKLSAALTNGINVAIRSTADWNKFAEMVKEADERYDVNAVLMDDITITTMVGGPKAAYRGTFHGNGHTLTFNINSTQQNTAPFSVVGDVTISDLRTVGTISSTEYYQSGLIGTTRYNSTIKVERCGGTYCQHSVDRQLGEIHPIHH